MPKRISKANKKRKPKSHHRPTDVNQLARHLVNLSTQEQTKELPMPTRQQISEVMAAIGRKGGKIGGKRRMVTMTPEQRSRVALKAAKARWENREPKQR